MQFDFMALGITAFLFGIVLIVVVEVVDDYRSGGVW